MEIDEEYEIRTPTTIASEMSSDFSIKNLSFLTKHESASVNQNNRIIIQKQKSDDALSQLTPNQEEQQ